MTINGKNLIISVNGQALAASKSCSISISGSTLQISSPLDGLWEHSIPGRKSWSVKTNHLLYTPVVPDGTIKAVSWGFTNSGSRSPSYVVDGTGRTIRTVARGISAIRIKPTAPYAFLDDQFTTWDTYTNPDAAPIVAYMDANTDCIIAVVCSDAFALTADMVAAFAAKNVTLPVLPNGRHALSIICGNVISRGTYRLADNDAAADPVAGVATADLYLRSGNVVSQTPLKNSAALVNSLLTLSIEVNGLPMDRLEGQAICKKYEVSGAVASLVQGSFDFEGTGPLE